MRPLVGAIYGGAGGAGQEPHWFGTIRDPSIYGGSICSLCPRYCRIYKARKELTACGAYTLALEKSQQVGKLKCGSWVMCK